ncbi:MAG: hypothetical protein MPJ25_06050, partial [Pirellulales bacterium]|nr:hypothetical protein [Pirellulales bacterium]
MVIEIKGLDGSRLDQKCMTESGHTILLTKSPDKNHSIVHPIQFLYRVWLQRVAPLHNHDTCEDLIFGTFRTRQNFIMNHTLLTFV